MAQGSRGYIGYKKETTWGTDPGGAATRFFPFISETLTPKIPDLLSAAQRGILDEPKSYQGEKSFGGDLIMDVHPVSIGHLLRSALGAPAEAALADSAETEICDCETEWDSVDSTITSLDPSDKKKGSNSSKIQVSKGHTATNVIASAVITERNITDPAVTQYKFWLKCNKITAAGNLKFRISGSELGGDAEAHDDVDIPAMTVANVWTEHTINIVDITGITAAISIALIMEDEMDEFEVRIDDVRVVVAGSADKAYKHIFTPMQSLAEEFAAGQQNSPLWPYTLDIFRDEGLPFALLGAVVNTLNLSFSTTDKILKAACGIIAKNQGVGTAAGLALEATKPFVWENAVISIGGAGGGAINNNLESFSLTWDNKCIAKYFLNNTAIPGKIIRDGVREIPVSFVIDFVNRTEYNHFLDGTERQFQILFEGAAVPEDTPKTPYTLQLDLPLVRYLTYPLNIGGPGRLLCAVTGKAKYSSGHVLQATLINAETTEYAG